MFRQYSNVHGAKIFRFLYGGMSTKRKKQKSNFWIRIYTVALVIYTSYILLDGFVIPHSYQKVETMQTDSAAQNTDTQTGDQNEILTDTSYNNGNVAIQITQYREYDTDIYVADITLSDVDELQAACANDTYGKNITATTSDIAANNNAILAINGDYYSARSGYVIRNGVLYRDTSAGADQEDLVIYSDGTCEVIKEGNITAQELIDKGAWQVLAFGPGLLTNSTITVSENEEVDQAKTSNPRTAFGMIDTLHYVMVVSDGRTSQSSGLSLYQMAAFMQSIGVTTAYNLDGGGSSTMVFNGTVMNQPTTDGNTISERKVSDIVYIK